MSILGVFFCLANIVGFLVFMIDKRLAKRKCRRIPEYVLILIGLCGGAAGSYLSMRIFRHKTSKLLFSILMPVMMVIQIGFLIWR